MKVYPVGTAEEGGHTFLEQIRHGRGEAGKDQANGQPITDEVLNVGGQLGDFSPVNRVDLVDRDDQACTFCCQQAEQLLPASVPVRNALLGELGCQPEPCRGEGSDLSCGRTVAELVHQTKHVIADPGQEPRMGRTGDYGPAMIPRDLLSRAQHDRLADTSGPSNDAKKPRRARALSQAVLELV